jgi:hypothetical protein
MRQVQIFTLERSLNRMKTSSHAAVHLIAHLATKHQLKLFN